MIRQLWVVETKENRWKAKWLPMACDVYETRQGARVSSANYNYDDGWNTPERTFLYRVRKYTPVIEGSDTL